MATRATKKDSHRNSQWRRKWSAGVKTESTYPRGRAVRQGCGDDCSGAGVKKGIPEGAGFGKADAHVLYQPGGEELTGWSQAGVGTR